MAGMNLRYHFYANEFGEGVAGHLGQDQGDLIVEGEMPTRHMLIRRRRERLAEGVHREIGAEPRQPGDGREYHRICPRQGSPKAIFHDNAPGLHFALLNLRTARRLRQRCA